MDFITSLIIAIVIFTIVYWLWKIPKTREGIINFTNNVSDTISPPQKEKFAAGERVIQRPGTVWTTTVDEQPKTTDDQFAYTIKYMYTGDCGYSRLATMFDTLAKEMSDEPSTAHIKFIRELVGPLSDGGGKIPDYPKMIKIRKSGQMLIYDGEPNYGRMKDWILNENLIY